MIDSASCGQRSCKRGRLPFLFVNSMQSLVSRARASWELVFRKRKWVTFMNRFAVLCEHNLERIDDSALPIYTTVPLYPSSYAPGLSGARSTISSVKEYHFVVNDMERL